MNFDEWPKWQQMADSLFRVTETLIELGTAAGDKSYLDARYDPNNPIHSGRDLLIEPILAICPSYQDLVQFMREHGFHKTMTAYRIEK